MEVRKFVSLTARSCRSGLPSDRQSSHLQCQPYLECSAWLVWAGIRLASNKRSACCQESQSLQSPRLGGSLTGGTTCRHGGQADDPHYTHSTQSTMDKVWFKLRQTDYPPPPEAAIKRGCTGVEAPICLGHIIEDLKSLDFAMNPDTIEPFPPNMRVFSTPMIDFRWNDARSQDKSVDVGASAPVATAAGVTLGADIKLAFSKSVGSHEEYERLDKYIVQPTQSYITDCLDEEPFASYTKGRITWSIFMVTGLFVARKGTSSTSDSSGATIGMGVEGFGSPLPPTESYKLLTSTAA